VLRVANALPAASRPAGDLTGIFERIVAGFPRHTPAAPGTRARGGRSYVIVSARSGH